MSKIIWGGLGAVVVLATSVLGAKIYADQSLAAYYQKPHNSQHGYQVRYANYEMGALTGSADIKLIVQRDPCEKHSTMVFNGKDRIERTWKGYVIHSYLELENKTHPYAQYFQQPLDVHTVINWTGGVKTTIQLPKMQLKEQQLLLQSEPIAIAISSQVKSKGTQFKNFRIEVPQLMIRNDYTGLEVYKMVFDTNQSSMSELVPGTMNWAADQIQFSVKDREVNAIRLNRVNFSLDTVIEPKTVNLFTHFKIGQVTVPNVNYENAEFNFDLKELSRPQMENYFRIFSQRDKSCAASKNFDADIEVALFQLLNAGFILESQKNKLETQEGNLEANIHSKIMPNYVNSKETLMKMLPSLLDAKVDVALDKDVLKSFLQLAPNRNAPVSDTEIEMILRTMEEQGRIQLKGDTIKMGLEYKFGQPNFNQYH